MARLRIYGVARTRAFRARATALKLRGEADAAMPAEITRTIARTNRL